MNEQEIAEFLALRQVGAVATLRADGSPMGVPIWFRWTGSEVKIWSSPNVGWVKRLREDPRVAFTVFEHEAPRRAFYVRGTASVVEGSMAELRDEIRAISARYIDGDVDRELASYDGGGPKAIVTITPSFTKATYN
jgi:nitroimidazol reductase NimA-like FMN-containing flavoprotein (pyridoxamine 5'-phosphate oxidase superfamily)